MEFFLMERWLIFSNHLMFPVETRQKIIRWNDFPALSSNSLSLCILLIKKRLILYCYSSK